MTQPSKSLPFTLKVCLWFAAAYLSAAAVAPLFGKQPAEFAMLVIGGPVLLVLFALGVFGIVGAIVGMLR